MKGHWWSFSTAIFLISISISVSTLLMIIPWEIINLKDNYTLVHRLMILVGTSSPLSIFLIYLYLNKKSFNKNSRFLKNTSKINMLNINYFSYFNKIFNTLDKSLIEKINFRIDGNIDIKDHPENIVRSPEVLKIGKNYTVVIPASFISRFKLYPKELSAVLLHEIGHISNKDIEILYFFKNFLISIIAVVLSYVFLSILASIQATPDDFISIYDISSSIIGKSYYYSIIASLVLLFIIHGFIKTHREIIADKFSSNYVGENALAKAEVILFSGGKYKISEARESKDINIFVLTPLWSIVSGMLAAMISSRIGAGILNYSNHLVTSDTILIYKSIVSISIFSIKSIIIYYFLLLIVKNINNNKAITSIKNSSYILFGLLIWITIENYLPLIIPTLLMPDGYSYFLGIDIHSYLLSNNKSLFLENCFVVLLILIPTIISSKTNFQWFGIIPSLLWILSSTLETNIFPDYTKGFFSPLLISIVIIIFYMSNRKNIEIKKLNNIPTIIISSILAVSSIYWLFGYKYTNYIATVNSSASLKYEKLNNIEKSKHYMELAVKYAPESSYLLLGLAILSKNDKQYSVNNISLSMRYINNISLFSERFQLLYGVTELLLELRRDEDKENLNKYFLQAERMWRENSRYPTNLVVRLLYNISCYKAVYEKDITLSSLYLLEAIAENASLGSKNSLIDYDVIINDSDLNILNIDTERFLSKNERKLLYNLKGGFDVPTLKLYLKTGEISPRVILRAIKTLTYK